MSTTLLPFLYQTKTLRRAVRYQNVVQFVRFAHSPARGRSRKQDNSIPFEWDHDTPYEEDMGDGAPEKQSTITPSEAEVFKGIFDEIAQGRMPSAKKRPMASEGTPQTPAESSSSDDQKPGMARSIVEQARVMEFRDKILRRYPSSLRNAAQVALGLYELEPNNKAASQMMELDEADQSKWEERAKYERARLEERERVDALMKACQSDAQLWQVMEEQVFSLPAKLGIVQSKSKTTKGTRGKGRKRASAAEPELELQQTADEEKRVMDIHGPLYPHFINTGLALFDTAFARPSDYAFQILPRIKELGLPSYVLGVSSSFYARLARIHWNRFGDATSALNVLQEMNSAGLYADEDVQELLLTMRDHLHGCTWGAQGPFVMGMMESPPYDGTLTQRLEEMEKYVIQSMNERTAETESLA
ncbi:hypothetical protein QQS21_006677 [Conoideocrella luteorostrata]|uniref:Mtf2-like C-terminal domain-containing protein n=1 Tax=Conoideocrella luteorostrata TaxID=1105319 RepID=A0AAJ0CMK4_9HYPO|nr:hypothetical protein QQS21_006677 [Conoideocrella luteorostrata]